MPGQSGCSPLMRTPPSARWSVPSDTAAFLYDEADFRVGGRDGFRCGSKQNPQYRGVTTYHGIAPNERIVWSETVENAGERLFVGLMTVTFEPAGPEAARTKLRLTAQVVSFAGEGMVENTRIGNNAALDNLTRSMR